MEKTAVEWLIDELSITNFLWLSDKPEMKELIKIIKKAKEMEKQQIRTTWDLSRRDTNHPVSGEQYYNTIYKVD